MIKNILPPIHLAASNDTLRPVMQYIEVKKGIATATNAHILVRMNLNEESRLEKDDIDALNGKLIHKEQWKFIYDSDFIKVETDGIKCTKNGIEYKIFFTKEKMSYVNYDEVLKNVKKQPRAIEMFSISSTLLSTISKIFGTTQIKIDCYGNNSALVCYDYSNRKTFALLMPIMCEQQTMDFMNI